MIYSRPDGVHHPAARVLACALLAAMLVLSFLAYPPTIHAQVKWRAPAGLPPLSGTDDTGRSAPVPLNPELDGTFPVSISTQPTLVWRNVPAGTGQVQFRIVSLAGGAKATSIWQTTVRVGGDGTARARVGPGVLRHGASYAWAAVSTSDGAQRKGPFGLTIDVQRSSVQPSWTLGDVSVAQVTGELVYSWQGAQLDALAGKVGWSLTHRPTNAPRPGLPSGWTLTVTGSTGWESLDLNPDGSVTLTNNSGASVSYTRTGANQWQPAVGRFATAGQMTMLTQNGDGTFSATDTSRLVTVFSKPTVNQRGYPIKVWGLDAPTIQQVWVAGRITKVTDPVTENTTSFFYGGDEGCGATTDPGFQAAPRGYLCGVLDWSGNLTLLQYVSTPDGPQIGRIVSGLGMGVNAGVQDIGWDDSGRIVETRTPFTTRVVASGAIPGLGADDDRVKTQVTYDAQGRVATITAPEGLITGAAQAADRAHRAQASFTYAPFTVRGTSDGAPVGILEQTWTDPVTMQKTRSRDRQGNVVSYAYDANGYLVRMTDEATNTVTETQYDAQGRAIAQIGPTRGALDSPTAPRTTTQYDRNPDGTPWTGLAVRYWDNAGFNDAPRGGTTGPIMPGATTPIAGLSANWPTAPVDTATGAWAARMTGLYVAAAEGAHVFQNTTTAQLWVNGSLCSPTCRVNLDTGATASLQLDMVSRAGEPVGINALVTPPGGQRSPIPTSALRPNYGLATASTVREFHAGGTTELVTRMVYDKVTTQLLETIAPSGAKQTRTYEPYDPAKGQWGRSTSVTDASGRTTTSAFAAAGAVGTDCQGTQLAQEGAQQSLTLPGGTTISQVVAPGGGAVKTTDGTTTVCGSTLPNAVGTASTTTGVGAEVTSSTTRFVNGDPLVVATTTTSQGETETSTARLDSNGSVWTTTDAFGTRTTIQSDPFSGLTTRKTETTAAGETRTIDYAYAPNEEVATITVNGRLLLTNEYAADGRLLRTVLANGAVQTVELDANNNGRKVETTFADGTVVSETAVRSPTGRLLGRTLSGPTGTSTFSYTYNVDGRLIRTTLAGTIPVLATEWASQYEGAEGLHGNRASKTTTLADGTKQTIAFTYGGDSRPLTASAGRLAGDITYDAAGRATRVGGVSLAYNAAGQLLSAADGGRAYTFTDGGATTTLTRTLPDGSSAAVSYSASGDTLILGPDRTIEGQLIGLTAGIKVVLDRTGAPARWIYEDMLGNMTWRSTGMGGPGRTHLYAPFGEPVSAQRGTAPATPLDLVINGLGWASGRGATTMRLAAPLMTIGARAYSSDAGRWLSADPDVNGSLNAYEYAIGDPVNMLDPTGNSPTGEVAGMIAAVVVGALIGFFTFGIGTAFTTAGYAAIVIQVAVAAGLGFLSGAVGSIVQQSVDKGFKNIDWSEVGIAAGSAAWQGAATAGALSYFTKMLPASIIARKLAYETAEEYNSTSRVGRVFRVVIGKGYNDAAKSARAAAALRGESTSKWSAMFTTKGSVFTMSRRVAAAEQGRLGQLAGSLEDPFAMSGSVRNSVTHVSARPATVNAVESVRGNQGLLGALDSSNDARTVFVRQIENEYAENVRSTIDFQQANLIFSQDLARFSAGGGVISPVVEAQQSQFQKFIVEQILKDMRMSNSFASSIY